MKAYFLILAAGAAVLLTGCVNPDGTQNNTGSGAIIGGAVGAITGAAIGGPQHGGEGALIGAGAGAVGGGLIGYSMDQEQQARLRQQSPETYAKVDQGQPLSLADVKALAKAGVSDDVIISQIQNTHTVYHLSAAEIIDLRDSNVSDKVVNFMINTPNTIGSASGVVQSDATVEPPAPNPGYVWIGGEWMWGGTGWIWVAGHWTYPPYPHAVWVAGRRWHDAYGWHYYRGYWR
jgi:outer membrane lipoprotein SlyB